jgi:hypothetical protein
MTQDPNVNDLVVIGEEEFVADQVPNEDGDSDEFVVDFTGVGEIPVGVALLKVTGMRGATSAAGNRMINMEFTIIDMPASPQFVNKKVWETWMLETDAKFRTYDGYEAFTGVKPEKGNFRIVKSEVLGQEAWCRLELKKAARAEYRDTARIAKYGAKSPNVA